MFSDAWIRAITARSEIVKTLAFSASGTVTRWWMNHWLHYFIYHMILKTSVDKMYDGNFSQEPGFKISFEKTDNRF